MTTASTPPIIIIGMHRSGTTMIVNLLESLGLFLGRDQNQNGEAMFFVHANRWLLHQSGGAWDHPETIETILNDAEVRALMAAYLRFLASTPRSARFMGWRAYLNRHSLLRLNRPWGWKDPRNTFTLPLWLDLFPDARVIHIYRNGVDVANSLSVRGEKRLAASLERWRRPDRRVLHSLWPQLFPSFTTRHMSLVTGFALWETYTRQADQHIATLPPERTCTIQYETFLSTPKPLLQGLCAFVGIAPDESQIDAACKQVNPAHAYAYARNETLRQFYEQVTTSPQMQRYGYDGET